MTRDEFEQQYAERSGMTVERLHAWGRYAEPCDCDAPECEGWAMGHQWEDALFEDAQRDQDRGLSDYDWRAIAEGLEQT